MKMINISSPMTTNMKPPLVSSIPSLMDINPNSPFEFHFPADEPWWDEYDTSDYTSDYNSDFSCDSLFSSESEFDLDEDLDISFNSKFYHISPTSMFIKEENEICRRSPHEDLVQKLISTISQIAPNFVYKRRKYSMKRRRNRRKRKRSSAENVEPELRSIWLNSVGDLFAPSAVSSKNPSPCSLPTINMSKVNKQMLRRLPDVVYLPVHSCSPDPGFYERNVPIGVHGTLTSKFWKENPFGRLPAIRTNMGPVSPPTDACYGYVWTDDGWRVKAEDPRVPDPGGGHGRGRGEEDRGGRVGGRDAKGGDRRCVRDIK